MRNWKTGFTLIEVLLGTIIIVLGFIGSAVFFYTNRKNLYNARIERFATWSAIEGMEEVKSRTHIIQETKTENITLGEYNVPAKRTISITEDENDNLVWKINVKVQWGEDNEVSLWTYLPKE